MNIKFALMGLIIPIVLWGYLRFNLKRNFIRLFSLSYKTVYVFDVLFFFAFGSRILYRLQNTITETFYYNYLINISYILLGFMGLLSFVFIFIDLFHFYSANFPNKPVFIDQSRRNFLKKNFIYAGVTSCSVITGAGYLNSFDPKVKKVTIPLPLAHAGLSGLKIIQLSDIHIGPTLNRDFCELLVTKVNELNADLIVITGDMIDGKVEYLKQELISFANFKSKLGTYFITGNHEYYWDAVGWINWVKSIGIKPLINENIKLNFNNTDFHLAGVNDAYSFEHSFPEPMDIEKATLGIPKDNYKILLAHQPKCCFEASKNGFHTQLSGHTHGGQGFPWNIIVTMLQPYVKGLYNHEGMNVYVHSGTGFWGPPNRFMIDSEIAEITFKV